MIQESLNPYAKSVRIRIPSVVTRTQISTYFGIAEAFGKGQQNKA